MTRQSQTTATVSSSVIEPAPAAAPAPESDAVPASVSESEQPIPTKSADTAPYFSQSPESIARELVRPDEVPVRPFDDSGSTRSLGQVVDRVSKPPLAHENPDFLTGACIRTLKYGG